MSKPPRSGDEALAGALGVSRQRANELRRAMPDASSGHAALDATIKAHAALADLDAARSIDETDVSDAASADDPLAELDAMVETRSERALRARLGAHASWAVTDDRTRRTAPARRAFLDRFERQVDPDGVLPPAERRSRAEHARKAYFLGLALKSARARRAKRF